MNQEEWMLKNVNELANAIISDGRLGGEKSLPLLEKLVKYPGNVRIARFILKKKLTEMGFGHLMANFD